MLLPKILEIPCSAPVNSSIRIPGSKSITNRAILIASLAQFESQIEGVLYSDDTKYMLKAWEQLGVQFQKKNKTLVIRGCNGQIPQCSEELYVGNAGTAARFLTTALLLGNGQYYLTGNERMQQRPIQDLIDALSPIGANIKDINGTGCPPLHINAAGLNGGKITIPGNKSSQYISSIMLSAPYANKDVIIDIKGHLVSRTYVEMTRQIMHEFGAQTDWLNDSSLKICSKHPYKGQNYIIEGDASSASYFFALAAINQGKVTVKGISPNSTQGDLGLLDILSQMGCDVNWKNDEVTVTGKPLKGISIDMNTMSDVAPTLAVIALFAEGKTHIQNVENMRIKECDRISALTTELNKIGADIEEFQDGLIINGKPGYSPATFETYDDHRMAMSFSLIGAKEPGIRILDPECVNKTFPDFFDYFLPMLTSK